MDKMLFGDIILFENKRCLSKFYSLNHSYEAKYEPLKISSEDIYEFSNEENKELEEMFANYRASHPVKQALLEKAKRNTKGKAYVRMCLSYKLVYGIEYELGNDLCKCNNNTQQIYITIFVRAI